MFRRVKMFSPSQQAPDKDAVLSSRTVTTVRQGTFRLTIDDFFRDLGLAQPCFKAAKHQIASKGLRHFPQAVHGLHGPCCRLAKRSPVETTSAKLRISLQKTPPSLCLG